METFLCIPWILCKKNVSRKGAKGRGDYGHTEGHRIFDKRTYYYTVESDYSISLTTSNLILPLPIDVPIPLSENILEGMTLERVYEYLPENIKQRKINNYDISTSNTSNNNGWGETNYDGSNDDKIIPEIHIIISNVKQQSYKSVLPYLKSIMFLHIKQVIHFRNISKHSYDGETLTITVECYKKYSFVKRLIMLLSSSAGTCFLFNQQIPESITKIIKDNSYWLEDVNDCQIIKELIKNERIVIEGNEFKTQLAIPLDFFKNNPAQDNYFTTEISKANIEGKSLTKLFVQEQNDLVKQLNLPKLSTIALKINGSYMEDFDIQNYKYEKLIEEHIQDLTALKDLSE